MTTPLIEKQIADLKARRNHLADNLHYADGPNYRRDEEAIARIDREIADWERHAAYPIAGIPLTTAQIIDRLAERDGLLIGLANSDHQLKLLLGAIDHALRGKPVNDYGRRDDNGLESLGAETSFARSTLRNVFDEVICKAVTAPDHLVQKQAVAFNNPEGLDSEGGSCD